jgi:hypothetical protein
MEVLQSHEQTPGPEVLRIRRHLDVVARASDDSSRLLDMMPLRSALTRQRMTSRVASC